MGVTYTVLGVIGCVGGGIDATPKDYSVTGTSAVLAGP